MPEDAGSLSVEYIVISDAAMRRLEKLQVEMDKVEKAAEKQGNTMELSFKQAGIAMAAFGAIAVGILYSIIKSSSYASMWFDQLKYTMMRFADKLIEVTGLKEDIETLFLAAEKFLDLWDKEGLGSALVGLKDDLIEFWNELSTTKKMVYGVIVAIIAIGAATTIVGAIMLTISIWKGAFLGLWGVLALVNTRLGIMMALKAALTWEILAVVLAVTALIAIFIWLWSKTDYGISKIGELNDIYDEFRFNVEDVGFIDALGIAFDRTFNWINQTLSWFAGRLKIVMSGSFEELKAYDAKVAAERAIRDKEIENAQMLRDREGALKKLREQEKLEGGKRLSAANALNEDLTEQQKIAQSIQILQSYMDGKELTEAQVDILLATQPILNNAYSESGEGALLNFTKQTDQIPEHLEDSLRLSAENAGLGTEWINDEMLALITDYMINVGVSFNGGPMGGAGWDAPYAGGPVVPGWKQIGAEEPTAPGQPDIYSATGAHVLRTGAAVIHQGEDIVNLKALMSGVRMDKTGMGGKDIVINNTITINSGDLRSPTESRRVANTISKQMGEELRRISTSI